MAESCRIGFTTNSSSDIGVIFFTTKDGKLPRQEDVEKCLPKIREYLMKRRFGILGDMGYYLAFSMYQNKSIDELATEIVERIMKYISLIAKAKPIRDFWDTCAGDYYTNRTIDYQFFAITDSIDDKTEDKEWHLDWVAIMALDESSYYIKEALEQCDNIIKVTTERIHLG
jgi:hypothetical protein